MSSSIDATAVLPLTRMLAHKSTNQSGSNPKRLQDWSYEAQWARDLETLERIERQREEAEGSFFCDMADIMAGRARG